MNTICSTCINQDSFGCCNINNSCFETSITNSCSDYHAIASKYFTAVETGDTLTKYIDLVKPFKQRYCYKKIQDFLASPAQPRVLALYGLRRTGKSTMLYQCLAEQDLNMIAYIKLAPINTIAQLYSDLDKLLKQGIKIVLIDEITLLNDFVNNANLLADMYAVSAKIIIAGTDSLQLNIASKDILYDRVDLIHTTFIAYNEYCYLLHINDFDTYLKYGGTLMPEGRIPFSNSAATEDYLNTAIVDNIQHGLNTISTNRRYAYLALLDVYYRYGVTELLNRILDDINHRFLFSVVNCAFTAHTLGDSKDNILQHSGPYEREFLAKTEMRMKQQFMELLCITDNRSYDYSDKAVSELKEYLKELDIVSDLAVEYSTGVLDTYSIFTQPGMQWSLAQRLVEVFSRQPEFIRLNANIKQTMIQQIYNSMAGRLLEDNIIYTTRVALHDVPFSVFQYRVNTDNTQSEFDMVVEDSTHRCCYVYEIKHSSSRAMQQAKHLSNTIIHGLFERNHFPISRKRILYLGDTYLSDSNDIDYINVADYLADILGYNTKTDQS